MANQQADLPGFAIRNAVVPLSKRRRYVLLLLADHRWHTTAEINDPDVGGSEGTRRLRELRASGHQIVKQRREFSDQWEYKLP